MSHTLLVVEDDPDIRQLLQVNLETLGVQLDIYEDGATACAAALHNQYDLMVLDIMLPNMSGLDICRQVRAAKPQQAIMMLTAKQSEMDHVLGLELGADDYMTKPFRVRELQARVRAQLRKVDSYTSPSHSASTETVLVADALRCHVQQRQVWLDKDALNLTAIEFDLLHYLMQHPGQVFSRMQLLEQVWGYSHCGYEHTVNSTINRLRSKIEATPAKPEFIQTVWGVGYRFAPKVRQ